jgi:hydroxyacylglutathione hydrolase
MILERFYNQPLAQASFLVGCPAAGEAVVIDPDRDAERYLQVAREWRVRVTAVTETHIHADFVSGSRELAERAGARLYLSDECDAGWKYAFAAAPNVTLVRDGDSIRAGAVRLDVRHTPGHTPEHVSFVLTDEAASPEPLGVFTGDFVFAGDVGRPDLLERAANQAGTMERGARTLFRSLRAFDRLPGHLMLWPGHGAGSACGKSLGAVPATTLAYERLANWALRVADESCFVAEVLSGQPDPPAYFKEMKRINRDGPPILGGFRTPPRVRGGALAALVATGELVVDLRARPEFTAAFIPGTVYVPANTAFTTWAGWLLPYDRDVWLVAADEAQAARAAREMAMIGLDRVAGWAPAEEALGAWRDSGRDTGVVRDWSAREAYERSRSGDVLVLDVRSEAEFAEGHVPGAANIPLGHLQRRAGELPRDRPVAVQCTSGSRSVIAAALLLRLGFAGVREVPEGLEGHVAAGLPVEPGNAGGGS